MWKAVRILSQRGVLSTARGRKSRLSIERKAAGAVPWPSTAAGDLCALLERRISKGLYKIGRELPKTALFVTEQRVSAFTVSEALHLLEHKNLAHKRGRRWFAGPSSGAINPRLARTDPDSLPPVALVITHSPEEFPKTFENNFTSPFLVSFRNEITGHRVQLQAAAATGQSFRLAFTPIGLDAIRKAIEYLGARYRGTLIMTIWPEDAGLAETIPALMRYDKPVFYFDSVNEGAELTRPGLGVGRKYFRGYFNERGAVDIAVTSLASAGHTGIGLLISHAELDWVQRRVRLIEESAARMSPPVEVFKAEAEKEFWTPYSDPDFDSFLRGISAPAAGRKTMRAQAGDDSEDRSTILANTPALAEMLRAHRPTALVALNDNLARQQYLWLRTLGFRIPRDISLISMDNLPHSVFFPYSTVDFGFSNLGYLAARLIIGDIPSSADPYGNIPGICTLIDRGSVGPPGSDERMQRLLM
jgi:hypothetical protein